VSRSQASKGSERGGTRKLLAELHELYREDLLAIFDQTLDVIETRRRRAVFACVISSCRSDPIAGVLSCVYCVGSFVEQ